MSAAKLFDDLINLPVESNDFEQIKNIKLEDFDDDSLEADSFGSCCSSSVQSNSDCSSPTHSCESNSSSPTNPGSDYFTFSAREQSSGKKKQTKSENKVKRNDRERRRVRRLAEGFRKLRTVVPGESKKLSKLQTLQKALEYMANLVDMVSNDNSHLTANRLEECQSVESQMYYSPYHQQQMTPVLTKTLSHPPMNWPFSPINQNEQLQQFMFPAVDPNIYSANMEQQPTWYFN